MSDTKAADLPYAVHTGRELAMMLAGTKPLAAFVDEYPSFHGGDVIPERDFEPHVASGRLIKREQIFLPAANAPIVKGQRIGLRRVLYAQPSEEWRIDAYLRLWASADTSGWSEELERQEGTLLGYEDWQVDWHIPHRFRSGRTDDSATPISPQGIHQDSLPKS